MQDAPAAPAPDFDREQFDELRALFDRARIRDWFEALDTLVAALEGALDADGAVPRAELAVAAHNLIGRSGLAGFQRFSEACRAFEELCRSGADLTDGTLRLRTEIARMRRRRMVLLAEIGI